MGFYFRKGFNFGPLRLNLSRSGLGASFGVKGARIGFGSRGSYVHVGRGGLYYRQNLSPSPSPLRPPGSQPDRTELSEIDSADVQNLTDSSSEDLLAELNRVHRRVDLFPIAFILSMVVVLSLVAAPLLLSDAIDERSPSASAMRIPLAEVLRERLVEPRGLLASIPPSWLWWFGAAVSLGGAIPITLHLRRLDLTRGRAVLTYELDLDAEQKFARLSDAFAQLASCDRVWHVSAQGDTNDWKRNAGARSLVKRKPIELTVGKPPRVMSNIDVPAVPAGREMLYFFPDRMVIYTRVGVGAVTYSDLQTASSEVQFIESDGVPPDAEVIGSTWRFVAKSGGPDRRFKDNYEIPIARYGELRLKSSSGLDELFQCSKSETVSAIAAALEMQKSEPLTDSSRPVAEQSALPTQPAQSTTGIAAGALALLRLLDGLNGQDRKALYNLAKEVYELIPSSYVLYYRGALAADCGDYDVALRDLRAAYEGRNDPHAWLTDEIERYGSPQGRDVSSAVSDILSRRLSENELTHNLALVYYRLHQFGDAKAWAEKILSEPRYRHQALKIVADSLNRLRRPIESVTAWSSCFAEAKSTEERGVAAANAACVSAALGREFDVAMWIERALKAGYDGDKLRADEDLREYIGRPAIQRALAAARQA
jgi:tetratricopeptide (TPR) repeat protein